MKKQRNNSYGFIVAIPFIAAAVYAGCSGEEEEYENSQRVSLANRYMTRSAESGGTPPPPPSTPRQYETLCWSKNENTSLTFRLCVKNFVPNPKYENYSVNVSLNATVFLYTPPKKMPSYRGVIQVKVPGNSSSPVNISVTYCDTKDLRYCATMSNPYQGKPGYDRNLPDPEPIYGTIQR